ncbi:unnamed protein product [Eruca vesicaria subsp. sativa]|uniref:Uncharacterized protein n=1 Tax=Eruca vesicaria subsp. sativa TaxID=29727 RepID=A0ABC8KSB1_ERUVS|nr:unnamed protein product [Eruca vesicaria subsp. sativa]
MNFSGSINPNYSCPLSTSFYSRRQFGYNSCFLKNHLLVYFRLILGFAGQFLCSYSTLPLYALVAQMGTNYKAALILQRTRDTIQGIELESQPIQQPRNTSAYAANESSSRVGTPLLRPCVSISSSTTPELRVEPVEPLSR